MAYRQPDVSGAATLASGSLTFNGNGALTNVTPIAGGTVSGAAGNLTGIAISGLTDGATNMTFRLEPVQRNGSRDHAGGRGQHRFIHATGWQRERHAGELQHWRGWNRNRIVQQWPHRGAGSNRTAEFGDVEGLQRIGANLFTETLWFRASGRGVGGHGRLRLAFRGGLELSNVDIATEFANLIVAQRAFEANAKAVTTFDQITQDTINLKQG